MFWRMNGAFDASIWKLIAMIDVIVTPSLDAALAFTCSFWMRVSKMTTSSRKGTFVWMPGSKTSGSAGSIAPKCFTMPTSPTPTCVNEPKMAKTINKSATTKTTPSPIPRLPPPPRVVILVATTVSLPRASRDAGVSIAAGAMASGAHDEQADHPVGLVPGEVAGELERPRLRERERGRPSRIRRERDLVRAIAVHRLGAGAVPHVERGVAYEPLVVDRVVVHDREGDGHAGRDLDAVGLEVRVVDADADVARSGRVRRRAGARRERGERQRDEDRSHRATARAPVRRSNSEPSARMRSGTHGFAVGIVTWTGVPSPTRWPRAFAASASNTAARKIGLRAA